MRLARLAVAIAVSIAAIAVIAANAALAQEARRRAIVPPAEGFQLTNRVVFLLDVSGSMQPSQRFDDALQAVNEIAEAPTDDLQIAVYVFTDTFTRWPGRPEPPGVPDGWARLPSQKAVDAFHQWVAAVPRNGNTDPAPALADALRERRPDTTVVMVTDGEFCSAASMSAWRREHFARRDLGLPDTPVVIMDVTPRRPDAPPPPEGTQAELLEAFARLGGGGLWALDAPAAPDPAHPTSGPW